MTFYSNVEKNCYLYDNNNAISNHCLADYNENLYCPIVLDSEFTGLKRKGVTVQISDINQKNPIIYAHPDLEKYATEKGLKLRHKTFNSEFCVIDYLKDLGIDIKLFSRKNKKIKDYQKFEGNSLPVMQFDIYAHFALAELLMMVINECKEDISNLAKKKKSKIKDKYKNCRLLEMTRRLRTVTYESKKYMEVSDSVELPWDVFLDKKLYRVRLRIIDTSALHGVASYKTLCESVGINAKYKDVLTQYDKENMFETYFNKPIEYDNYALGDLEVYKILANNGELFYKVYESLGIRDYFKEPKLTIGSTVQKLFKAVLFNHFDIKPDDKETQKRLIDQCIWASASTLKNKTDDTKCLLAKINGGRCRNNRPLTPYLEGTIIDIDISGAYGNGLRHQIYPIGRPLIESYEVSEVTDHNGYLTLREWLKDRKYGKKNNELINGLWCLYVSTMQDKDGNYKTLTYEQDFITSWFDFKFEDIATMESDIDNLTKEINSKTGTVKILNKQVINGLINSDILEIILNICNPKQRNELLDNLFINVSCYYPAYSEVKNLNDLLDAWENWDEKNTTRSKINKSHKLPSGQVIKIINEPTYWLGLNLGELLIDNLLAWRKFYKIKDGDKCAMEILFKLSCNTLYGVFCSPYFDISNTIVGNNITARCRTMAWMMEKGFNMVQSITDGGQFDINAVVYPISDKRSVTATNVTNLYQRRTASSQLSLKPLDNQDKIEHFYDENKIKIKLIKDNKEKIINNANDWINEKSLEHLRKIFKGMTILEDEFIAIKLNDEKSLEENKPFIEYSKVKGIYSLEIKNIYDYGCFHGTANYLMENKNYKILAMRSYESNKKHFTFELKNGCYDETNFYIETIPSEYFLNQLKESCQIKRSKPFKKTSILKLNDYRHNVTKYEELGLECGDSIEKSGMLRELSLSQFTFKTIEQLKAIEKEINSNKRRYAQSYEGFFINQDDSLNYLEMIKTIDKMIDESLISFNKELDKYRNRNRDFKIYHPEINAYNDFKELPLIELSKNLDIITVSNYKNDEYAKCDELVLDEDILI
jgi:hypothetical protein